jgi:hypothetical protein
MTRSFNTAPFLPSQFHKLIAVIHLRDFHSISDPCSDSCSFDIDAASGVLSRIFDSDDPNIRGCAFDTLRNMLAEFPSETYSFLIEMKFTDWLSQLAAIPLDYGPSLFDCLSKLVAVSVRLGRDPLIAFDMLPLLLSPLQSHSISDQLLLESCLNFVTWLSQRFADYRGPLILFGAFDRALAILSFACPLLTKPDLPDQIFATNVTCAAACAIGVLLMNTEIDIQIAQELYSLMNAMWDPTTICSRNSAALFCLANLIAVDPNCCSTIDFRPGLYHLIRMTDQPTLCNAFHIFERLGPGESGH